MSEELSVEVFGITVLIRGQNRIGYPDGRRPRLSSTDPSNVTVIPAHHAFMAFQPGTYAVDARPHFSYSFDIGGSGDPKPFDAWLLDGHRIRFDAPDGTVAIDNSRVIRLYELFPGLGYAPDLEDKLAGS